MMVFEHKQPTEKQITLMEFYRKEYEYLNDKLKSIPESRELSIAKTKLEESSFWLNKAIVGYKSK